MTRRFSLLAALLLASLSAVAPAAEEEMVPNPEYVAWSSFKPGSSVTLTAQMEIKGLPPDVPPALANPPATEITKTLISVDADKAVVDIKLNPQAGMVMGQRHGKREIPAKVAKSKLDSASAPPGSKINDVKEGAENIEIAGKKYDAKTRDMNLESTSPPGKGTVKTWFAEGIPGGMVKLTMNIKSSGNGNNIEMSGTQTLVKTDVK